MKTFAILVLLVLGTTLTKHHRRTQSVVATPTASTSGSTSGSGSVKVGVKVPSVKVTAGTSGSTTGSTSGSGKVSGTVKVPSVKVTGSTSGSGSSSTKTGGSVKIGVSGSTKTGGSVKIGVSAGGSTKAAVDTTGTCPQAANFGFKPIATVATSGLKYCTMLKASCCDVAEINKRGDEWKAWTGKLGSMVYSFVKSNNALATLMSNLKPGFGDAAAATPATTTKRILQSVVATPKTSGSVKVSGGVSGGASTSTTGKTGGSVKIGVKVPSVKVTGGVTGGASTSGSATGKTGGSVKVTAGTKTTGTAKTTGTKKVTVKVTVKATAKPKPSEWNAKNTKTVTLFRQAWNSVNMLMQERNSFYDVVKGCYLSVVKIKAQLTCAVCDNKNEKAFAKELNVKPADLTDMQNYCGQVIAYAGRVVQPYRYVLAYVAAASGDATVAKFVKFMDNGVYLPKDLSAATLLKKCATATTPAKAPATKRVLQSVVATPPKATGTVKVSGGVSGGASTSGSTTGKTGGSVKIGVKVPSVKVTGSTSGSTKTTGKTGGSVKVTAGTKTTGTKTTSTKTSTSGSAGVKISISIGGKATSVLKAPASLVDTGAKVTIDSWTTWQSGYVQTGWSYKVNTGVDCQGTQAMRWLSEYMLFKDKSADVWKYGAYFFAALSKGFELATTAEGQKQWTDFKGTFIAAPAKPLWRRLQSVVPAKPAAPAKPTTPTTVTGQMRLETNTPNVDLTAGYANTGFVLPTDLAKDASQVALKNSNLIAFSALAALLMMFFN